MTSLLIIFIGAIFIDLLIGDPDYLTHPVVYIGRLIERLEQLLYPLSSTPGVRFIAGSITTLIVVGLSYGVAYLAIKASFHINYWLGILVSTWIFSTTIATTSLKKAALAIYTPLMERDLSRARHYLSHVVGRDTQDLEESEIARGAIETVAENTVDGIIAPLFYGLLGGPALAMAYKAVNTLDSMIGYKNEKYLHYGRFAARLDDVANYIPARITGLCLIVSSMLLRLSWQQGLSSWRKYAHLHPSPNGGIPESVVAGVLGIRLGGLNSYFGQPQFRAYMGESGKDIEAQHIKATVTLMYYALFIFSFLALLILALL